jgi:hypothetical protein
MRRRESNAAYLAGLRFCADEKPSARIVDGARMKSYPRTIDDLE